VVLAGRPYVVGTDRPRIREELLAGKVPLPHRGTQPLRARVMLAERAHKSFETAPTERLSARLMARTLGLLVGASRHDGEHRVAGRQRFAATWNAVQSPAEFAVRSPVENRVQDRTDYARFISAYLLSHSR